jgi:hypothetical protein
MVRARGKFMATTFQAASARRGKPHDERRLSINVKVTAAPAVGMMRPLPSAP